MISYNDIRKALDDIKSENKFLDNLTKEYDRFTKIKELEQMKQKPNEERLIAINKHLENLAMSECFTLAMREIIVSNLVLVSDTLSALIMDYFFENMNYPQMEIKYHYSTQTIKTYIQRGIEKLVEVINNDN